VVGVDPHELKETWLNRSLARAGIERGSWRPARGVAANRRTVEAVYDYYGRLFLEHPYLEWAGMASMIGPAFYAGFRDLGLLPDTGRRAVSAVVGRLSPPSCPRSRSAVSCSSPSVARPRRPSAPHASIRRRRSSRVWRTCSAG